MKPRICAKKPRLIGTAPTGVRAPYVQGETSFAEFLIEMNRADKENEEVKRAKAVEGVLVWADILSQR